jgi:hypothetical protein
MTLCSKLFILFINITGGSYNPPHTPTRLRTCSAIVTEAQAQSVDPVLAVSVAWVESAWLPRIKNKRSSAIGPMQILPRYWCPGRDGRWRADGTGRLQGCDLIEGGVRALRWYTRTRPTRLAAIAAYGYKSQDHEYVWLINHLYESAELALR